MAIFGTTGIAGRPDFEATLTGGSGLEYGGILPFDNSRGYITSVALLNPSSDAKASMPATIHDESGAIMKTDSIDLAAGKKIAFTLAHRWPEIRGRRGRIRFQGSFSSWAVLGLRFHPSGAFTTIPVLEQ